MSFHQEVNFYLPIFRKVEVPFSGKIIIQGCSIIVVALAAIFIFSNIQITVLKARLVSMEEQELTIQAQIAELIDRKSSRNADSVYSEVERLKVEINAQRALVRQLGNFKGANRSGFSTHMESFSEQYVDGLWLTHFSIQDGGERVEMEGKSIRASNVPSYIGKLKGQEQFSNSEFGLIKLESQDFGKQSVLGFSLGREKNQDG